uniref:Uncharacterized protein n=1 Tax=Panagrolaimus sp. ES5 TaxID=591445 RepID=A0AC34FHI1_9BILA
MSVNVYNSVWENVFQTVIPQNCFVFVILNGNNIQIPSITKDPNCKYINQTAVDDTLINGFSFQEYLDAVVAVGYENDFTRIYKEMQKDDDTNGDPVKEDVERLLRQGGGLFFQTVFLMSSEAECQLRKAAMMVSMDSNFDTSSTTIDRAKLITNDVIGNPEELERYGSICWKKSYNMFIAQPPSRLTKEVVQREV